MRCPLVVCALLLCAACGEREPGPGTRSAEGDLSPALRSAAERVLEEADAGAVLVGRIVILEDGAPRALGGHAEEIEVSMDLWPAGVQEPGTGAVPAQRDVPRDPEARLRTVRAIVDQDGVFALPIESGDWEVRGHGVGVLARSAAQGDVLGKVTRWAPPSEVSVSLGSIHRLPDVLFVPPILTIAPAAGARFPAVPENALPGFQWEPYPDATEYELRLHRIERTETTHSSRHWAVVRVARSTAPVPWDRVQEGILPVHRMQAAPPLAGTYSWSVRAYAEDGTELSSGRGSEFVVYD